MPTKAKAVNLTELSTATEVAQMVVARAASWASYNGYNTGEYFAACGLARYRKGGAKPLTVDLTKVLAALATKLNGPTMEIVVNPNRRGEIDPYEAREAIRGKIYASVGTEMLTPDMWTMAEDTPDAIDPAEYLGRAWGSYNFPVPSFTTDEARAEAQRIVTAALTKAQADRACDSPENLIRNIGFGDFLPPATTAMEVEVPGIGTVAFEVENDRMGQPRTDRLEIKIRNAAGAKLMEMIQAGALEARTVTPATA